MALNGYRISEYGKAITCLECGMTSHNRGDVEHRYCGNCHVFHDDPPGAAETRQVLVELTRKAREQGNPELASWFWSFLTKKGQPPAPTG